MPHVMSRNSTDVKGIKVSSMVMVINRKVFLFFWWKSTWMHLEFDQPFLESFHNKCSLTFYSRNFTQWQHFNINYAVKFQEKNSALKWISIKTLDLFSTQVAAIKKIRYNFFRFQINTTLSKEKKKFFKGYVKIHKKKGRTSIFQRRFLEGTG